MRRGEIRWYDFAPPDKRRPVLLLTREGALRRLNEVTVAPITTTIRKLDSEVRVGLQDGLESESVINCDHLQTVAKHRLTHRITALGEPRMQEVERAVNFALGFRLSR